MKAIRSGKRRGFANEAGQTLPQGIESALDTVGLTAVFADRLVTVSRENTVVSEN
jgi:hypothetical protein